MTEQIKFAGEQGSLVIEVCDYERGEAEDQDDANWLKCRLSLTAGPFGGTFNAAFTTFELSALCDRLRGALATVSGALTFENTEDDIAFGMEFDKRGAAIINGTAHPHRSLEASLGFRFDTDQSYMAQTLLQLDATLRRFPVKQLS